MSSLDHPSLTRSLAPVYQHDERGTEMGEVQMQQHQQHQLLTSSSDHHHNSTMRSLLQPNPPQPQHHNSSTTPTDTARNSPRPEEDYTYSPSASPEIPPSSFQLQQQLQQLQQQQLQNQMSLSPTVTSTPPHRRKVSFSNLTLMPHSQQQQQFQQHQQPFALKSEQLSPRSRSRPTKSAIRSSRTRDRDYTYERSVSSMSARESCASSSVHQVNIVWCDETEQSMVGPSSVGAGGGGGVGGGVHIQLHQFGEIPLSSIPSAASAALALPPPSPVAPLHIDWSSHPYSIDYRTIVLGQLGADFLTSLPSDCLWSVLVLCDAGSLAAVASCSNALCCSAGAEAEELWREVARKDVARLSYPERRVFEDLPNADIGYGLNVHGGKVLSSRELYMLRLKQHSLAKAGARAELRRVKQVRIEVCELLRNTLEHELKLETTWMISVPIAGLACVGLIAGEQPVWAIFLPVWILVVFTITALLTLHLLRSHSRATIIRKTKGSTITTTPSQAGSHIHRHNTHGHGPTHPSQNSALKRRNDSNLRFLLAASAQPKADGILQGILETWFLPTPTSLALAATNHDGREMKKWWNKRCVGSSMKVAFVLASVIMLCIKESHIASSNLSYTLLTTPIFFLFAWNFFYPLIARSNALTHAKRWCIWSAPVVASLVLLVLYLDHYASSLTLQQVYVPLWMWESMLLFILLFLTCQFGIGLRIERVDEIDLCTRYYPWRIIRDHDVKHQRMMCTMMIGLATGMGIVAFQILQCLRSSELREREDEDKIKMIDTSSSGADPASSSTSASASSLTWSMSYVSIPLLVSLFLSLLFAVVSATQMIKQRRDTLEERLNVGEMKGGMIV